MTVPTGCSGTDCDRRSSDIPPHIVASGGERCGVVDDHDLRAREQVHGCVDLEDPGVQVTEMSLCDVFTPGASVRPLKSPATAPVEARLAA